MSKYKKGFTDDGRTTDGRHVMAKAYITFVQVGKKTLFYIEH